MHVRDDGPLKNAAPVEPGDPIAPATDDAKSASSQQELPFSKARRSHPLLRWLLRIVVALFGLLVVAGAALAFVVHNAVYLVDQNLDKISALGSEHFERPLTIGAVRGRIFPRLAVIVDGLELGSRVKGGPPLLQLPSIEIRFRTDRALLTLGRELITESVRVDGGIARIRRDFDGEVDMLDVVKRLPPLDPEDIQGAVIQEVVIHGVTVEYVDEPAMQVVKLRELHLETHDAGLGIPFNALLTAVWAGPEAPVVLKVHVDEVPRDLALWPFPVSTIDLALDDVDIADAVATFGIPPSFDDGEVDLRVGIVNTAEHHMQVAVDLEGEATTIVVDSGTGAGVEKAGVHGPVAVFARVDHDIDAGDTILRALSVSLAGMHLDARATSDSTGLRTLEGLVAVEQLARLGTVVPPLLTTAPGSFVIHGEAHGWFSVDDEKFLGDFDFGGARVGIGEALSKFPGERLSLQLDGVRNIEDDITSVDGFFRTALVFGLPRGTRIAGTLLVPDGEGHDTILQLGSNTIDLGTASSISPILNDLFGTEQPGKLKARAFGRISAARTSFDIDLDLTQLGLNYDRATAVGKAVIHFDIDADQSGLALGLRADGTAMALQSKDEEDKVVFEKGNTEPMLLTAALREVGGRGSLGKAMENAGASGDIIAGDGLAPRWRTIISGLQGKASLTASKVLLAGIKVSDVQFALGLRRGELTIDKGTLAVFGGEVSLNQTTAALTTTPARWGLALKASGLSAKQLLVPLRRFTGAVSGTIDLDAKLAAEGLSIGAVAQSLDGPLTVSTHNVHLGTLDVISGWFDAIWDFIGRIPGVDPQEVRRAKGDSFTSSLADGEWTMRFKRDQFMLDAPMFVDTTFGRLKVEGWAGFDGSINFTASLGLTSEPLRRARLVSNDKPLDLRVGITGTWNDPIFSSDNFDILRTAVQERLQETIDKALKSVQDRSQTVQDRVNLEVDRAQRSVEKSLGIEAAGNSKSYVGDLSIDDGTSAIGDFDVDTRPLDQRGPPTPAPEAEASPPPATPPATPRKPNKKKAPQPREQTAPTP